MQTDIPRRSQCASDDERLETAGEALKQLGLVAGLGIDMQPVGPPAVEVLEVSEQCVRMAFHSIGADVEISMSSVSIRERLPNGEFAPELMATLLRQLAHGLEPLNKEIRAQSAARAQDREQVAAPGA